MQDFYRMILETNQTLVYYIKEKLKGKPGRIPHEMVTRDL